ncbi:hypothetical protein SNE40_012771 [Patella caerulea]
MAGVTRLLASIIVLCGQLNTCVSQSRQGPPGPFEYVRGNHSDFESKAMYLQGQYCDRVCEERFKSLKGRNPRCAPCFCDDDCYHFGDCCPDKILFDKTPNITTSREYGCIPIKFYKNSKDYTKVIDECPETYTNQGVISNCYNNNSLHWKYIKPVTDPNTKLNFRNKYCAICNNVFDTFGWSTQTDCSESSAYGTSTNPEDIYFTVLNSDKCSLSFKSDIGGERSCSPVFKPFYSRCNETGRWSFYDKDVDRACHLYTNVVDGIYKNLFCRICNEDVYWRDMMKESSSYVVFASYSLSTLLDLRDDDEFQVPLRTPSRASISANAVCGDDELMDPVSCECMKKACSDQEILVDGGCQSVFLKSNNVGYKVCLQVNGTFNNSFLVPPENILSRYVHFNFPPWTNATAIVTSVSILPITMEMCTPGIVDIDLKVGIKIVFTLPVNTDEKQVELLTKAQNFGEDSSGDGFNMKTVAVENCDTAPIPKTIPVGTECMYMNQVAFTHDMPLIREVALLLTHAEFHNLNKLMTCTQVLVNSTQVVHNAIYKTVTLLHNDLTLTDGEFESRGEYFAVCSDDYLRQTSVDSCLSSFLLRENNLTKYNAFKHTTTTIGITSVVCTCISLLFLIITLIFYCAIKTLRNVVGVNVMGLIVTLFVAQIIYEFGLEMTDYPKLCQAVGILIHYFWLSSTFWMNACTFILFLKLTYPLTTQTFTTVRIFKRCFIYSTLSPLIIVGITLGVNYGMDGNCGYGGTYSCYIRSVNERRFAFALPLGLLILFNISLFSYTFIKMRASWIDSARNREHKINILACLKLSVITGASWIFAFVYEATKAVIFAYFFTILVGAQGIVIFLAFIGNKRLCLLFAVKTRGKSYSNSSGYTAQRQYIKNFANESPQTSLTLVKSNSDQENSKRKENNRV